MTPEKLLEIMGEIDDKYIDEADPTTKNNVIHMNFAALAGIAAGFVAIAVVGHTLLTNYGKTNSINETQYAATAEIAGIEEAAEDDMDFAEEAAEDEGINTYSADSGAAMGAASTSNAGASTRDAKAKNAAADNSMPESVNEEENFYKDEVQSVQPSAAYNTFDFENGAFLQYPLSMSERVLTATEKAVKESGSDTSVYWYTALSNENAAAILSELGTKINTAEDINYIAQYFDDVNAVDYEGVKLVGYIAVNENGDVVENRLEGEK